METIIKVKNLTKTFKSKVNQNLFKSIFKPKFTYYTAVKGIDLEIKKGEAVAFLGPNGAGKTTTTKMLTGLVYPTEGEIEVLGVHPFKKDKSFLRKIGVVMGNRSGLNWDLTPMQSFEILKHIYNISEEKYEARVKELVEILDVGEKINRPVRKLSLGERMKVEMIASILHEPELLFLDEPTIGLDITSKKKLREFLKKLHQESQITFILTSHDMDDIEDVCDRVVVINNGEKIYDGQLNTLAKEYSKEKVLGFVFKDKYDLAEIAKLGEVISSTSLEVRLKVEASKMPQIINAVTSNYELEDIEIISTPLEDIIEDLYQKK